MERENEILEVQVEEIIPNRFQPRLSFDDKSLEELSESIKEHGIIQPLVLRRLGNKFEIIAGERRYKAAVMAGLEKVPAIISNVDDNKSAEVAIVENLQRRNLSSIEEAVSYRNLLSRGYLTQEQLAQKMGVSQSTIANKLRLLNLPDEVQKALMEEKISERHARSLLNVANRETQLILLARIISERMTVRQLDNEIQEINGGVKPQENVAPEMNYNQVNNVGFETQTANYNPVNMGQMPVNNTPVNPVYNTPVSEPVNMNSNYNEPVTITPNNMQIEEMNMEPSSQVMFSNVAPTETAPAEVNPTMLEFGAPNPNVNYIFDNSIQNSMNNVPQNVDTTVPKASTYEDFSAPAGGIDANPNNKFFNFLEDEKADLSAVTNTIDPQNATFDSGLNVPIQNGVELLNNQTTVPSIDTMVDPTEAINRLDPDYVEPTKNTVVNDYQLNDVISDVRGIKDKIEGNGYVISLDELDLSDKYQFIITVNKE